MSIPKKDKSVARSGGGGGKRLHRKAARVAATTTRRVFCVATHERSLLIGPNGRTLRKLLTMYDVRMSLSRGGQITVLGQEQRVDHAVAHISRLLRYTTPGAAHYMAAAQDSFRRRHVGRSLGTHPAIVSPPFKNPHVPSAKELWTKGEMLRALGRRLGAVLMRVLEFVSSFPLR